MFKNYFKVAWRNIAKSKTYSAVNIIGLAAGMAVAMIISLWIYDEVSANKNYKNYDSVYQVMMNQTFDGTRGSQQAMPYPLAEELKHKFPDFKAVALPIGDKNVHSNTVKKESAGSAILLEKMPCQYFP